MNDDNLPNDQTNPNGFTDQQFADNDQPQAQLLENELDSAIDSIMNQGGKNGLQPAKNDNQKSLNTTNTKNQENGLSGGEDNVNPVLSVSGSDEEEEEEENEEKPAMKEMGTGTPGEDQGKPQEDSPPGRTPGSDAQEKYFSELDMESQKRYDYLMRKNVEMRSFLIDFGRKFDEQNQRKQEQKLQEFQNRAAENARIKVLNEEIKEQQSYINEILFDLKQRKDELKKYKKADEFTSKKNELTFLKREINNLVQEQLLIKKTLDGQNHEIEKMARSRDLEDKNKNAKLREELDDLKKMYKMLGAELDGEEKESKRLHQEIVSTKAKIKNVKTFGKKVKNWEKQKGKQFMKSENTADSRSIIGKRERSAYSLKAAKSPYRRRNVRREPRKKRVVVERVVLDEDIAELDGEIKDLEADIRDLTFIGNADKEQMEGKLAEDDKVIKKLEEESKNNQTLYRKRKLFLNNLKRTVLEKERERRLHAQRLRFNYKEALDDYNEAANEIEQETKTHKTQPNFEDLGINRSFEIKDLFPES